VCRSVRRVLFRFHEVTLGLGLGHDQDFFGFRSELGLGGLGGDRPLALRDPPTWPPTLG